MVVLDSYRFLQEPSRRGERLSACYVGLYSTSFACLFSIAGTVPKHHTIFICRSSSSTFTVGGRCHIVGCGTVFDGVLMTPQAATTGDRPSPHETKHPAVRMPRHFINYKQQTKTQNSAYSTTTPTDTIPIMYQSGRTSVWDYCRPQWRYLAYKCMHVLCRSI
jgi:hypothetical protein